MPVILSAAKNLRRVFQHKQHLVDGFTKQYRVDRLVHFEETADVLAAIEREKQIKGWVRAKKIALIESGNPTWEDLTEAWYKADSKTKADSSLRSE
jgi:putative endonuclease